MRRGYANVFLLLLFVIKTSLTSWIIAENEQDTWMDPDAWARDNLITGSLHSTDKCCKCSEGLLLDTSDREVPSKKQRQTIIDDAASLIYFKKFITLIFNRGNCEYDSTQQVYKRSIIFTIESSQMDKLEQSQDPRDLDSILAEIFNNIRTPNMYNDGQQQFYITSTGFKTIVLNLLCDLWQLTKISEIRFLLVVFIIILVAWTLKKRIKIAWLPLGFCSIFIYGYLYTYLECNRELEVNRMLEILNRDSGSEKPANGFNFFNFFKGIFYNGRIQDLAQQKLKQSAKLHVGFCRPDHVLIKYFNEMFIKYLEVLIEQCTVTLTTLNSQLGFPYNILSGLILVCMIGYVTKLTFKYIFSPSQWMQYIHYKQSYRSDPAAIKSLKNSQDDRISGDNLKLLLTAINGGHQRIAVTSKLPNMLTVSGVEDVWESIEATSEKLLTQPENSSSNRKPPDEVADEESDVKIDDLLEDS